MTALLHEAPKFAHVSCVPHRTQRRRKVPFCQSIKRSLVKPWGRFARALVAAQPTARAKPSWLCPMLCSTPGRFPMLCNTPRRRRVLGSTPRRMSWCACMLCSTATGSLRPFRFCFRIFSLLLFFLPGCSSSDLLRLHVEETRFPFHGGRFVSLLCSTAQLHRSLEATMACARGLSSSDNGHESHGKC